MKPVLLVIGTRPDAIKLIPLYFVLKKEEIPVVLCSTFQHDELLKQVLTLFNVCPDISLNVMKENQDLFYLTEIILEKMKQVYEKHSPKLVVVQGDTTTALASALAAFYKKIPLAHVEAGIRSFDKYGPFPEEANRKIISVLADFHFAPTQNSVLNLLHEGISKGAIFQTGNTVTDALRLVREKINNHELTVQPQLALEIQQCKRNHQKIIFFTTHRRESFGQPLETILSTIKQYAAEHEDVCFFFPVHPNPQVQQLVQSKKMAEIENIKLYKPLSYENAVYLLQQCDLVVTDSGGLQEEATSFGKNSVILREKTDRPESVFAGMARVVGSAVEKIEEALDHYLYIESAVHSQGQLYGDGYAGEKIAAVIQRLTDKRFMLKQKSSSAIQKEML